MLATAAIPSKGTAELAKKMDIKLNPEGFVNAGVTAPVRTSKAGIFACGFCLGPADIPESVAQASAAAGLAAEVVLSAAS